MQPPVINNWRLVLAARALGRACHYLVSGFCQFASSQFFLINWLLANSITELYQQLHQTRPSLSFELWKHIGLNELTTATVRWNRPGLPFPDIFTICYHAHRPFDDDLLACSTYSNTGFLHIKPETGFKKIRFPVYRCSFYTLSWRQYFRLFFPFTSDWMYVRYGCRQCRYGRAD